MRRTTLKTIGAVSLLVMLVVLGHGFAVASDVNSNLTRAGEISLLSNQLDERLDHLGRNIKQEADLYANYISYYEDSVTHDFWNNLEQIKLEQGEIIEGIALLRGRLALHVPLRGQITEGAVLSNSTDPTYLSGLFSYWRGFYFLISGGFLMINIGLLYECYAIEYRGRDEGKRSHPMIRKAA